MEQEKGVRFELFEIYLIIFAVIVAMCFAGIVFLYVVMKRKTIDDERLDKLIHVGKWMIVSVFITTATSAISIGFKEWDQKLKEIEFFEKYSERIINLTGPYIWNKRAQYSEYFSAVAPKGNIRDGWMGYNTFVKGNINELEVIKKELKALENKNINGALMKDEKERMDSLSLKYDELNLNFTGNITSLNPPANRENLNGLVYIQVFGIEQKKKIEEFANSLRSIGLSVPGIENVEDKAKPPEVTSVRYFYNEDINLATKLAERLKNNGYKNATIVRLRGMEVAAGTIEVWLSKSD
ncbi:hypothetical protein RHD99_11070 [Buttiauxella selenatireducens]|uniref:SPOR domain-containing protein n=1 Tax=Buttiauxella selenatireducens TaxID=3073902 RepID=A0ABY9SFZ2_9ENTR|nr:hypothetical protein [Buttiauxella sp. R73]WMY76424.1 hypothetical protein RHD99_11070 [Buttiauxella sp. R73]